MRLFKKEVLLSMLTLTLGVFLISNQAIAQEVNQEQEQEVEVTGTVMDASTDEPVSEVEVGIVEMDEWTTTDSEGSFSFSSVEPGTYTIYVEAEGYETWEEQVEVTEDDTSVDIELEPMDE